MSKITIDNGWLLDQDLDKARVIEQEDARVFRATAIAAYLDREFESASLSAMSPCPVQDEEGKIIGFADVYEKNRKIVVEMVIDNATPERLTAEMREGVRHYARLRGIVHRRSRGGAPSRGRAGGLRRATAQSSSHRCLHCSTHRCSICGSTRTSPSRST